MGRGNYRGDRLSDIGGTPVPGRYQIFKSLMFIENGRSPKTDELILMMMLNSI